MHTRWSLIYHLTITQWGGRWRKLGHALCSGCGGGGGAWGGGGGARRTTVTSKVFNGTGRGRHLAEFTAASSSSSSFFLFQILANVLWPPLLTDRNIACAQTYLHRKHSEHLFCHVFTAKRQKNKTKTEMTKKTTRIWKEHWWPSQVGYKHGQELRLINIVIIIIIIM